ncbi:MAG: hypothetical protein JNK82_43000 [Myxococcaceae bacterium]|nr:hypothetical protein [Myxococcaceae bacterium]
MRRASLMLLACACAGAPAPSSPQPSSVTPSRVAAGAPSTLTIGGMGFDAEIFTDWRRPSWSELRADFAVTVVAESGAETALAAVTLLEDGSLSGELPAMSERGLYDVVVTDPRGNTGTLTGALRVVTSAESIASFVFDAIEPQRAGVPFAVGVTAVDEAGRTVEGFDGVASLLMPDVAVLPIGPFVLGRARRFVTVAQPATGVKLSAFFTLSLIGVSAPFDVTPGEAARVAFIDAPARFTAGACGGPFTLEVQDTFGNPASASAMSAFTLAVNPPEGGQLFADAACGAAMAGGTLQGRTSFFVRSTRAGRPELRVVPEAWPSATRAVDVDAGAAVGLEIVSAPQVLAAGMCSRAVRVRARDAFGNASPVESASALEVSIGPATGVTLHSDGACASPLNVLELSAGGLEARFHFRSAVPAMLTVSVDGGVLGVAAQGAEVTP